MGRIAKIIESRHGEASCSRKGERYIIAEVNGERYRVNVFRGRRVRLAYGARFGFRWNAVVQRVADGRTIYDKGVEPRTIAVDEVLRRAGVLPKESAQ